MAIKAESSQMLDDDDDPENRYMSPSVPVMCVCSVHVFMFV